MRIRDQETDRASVDDAISVAEKFLVQYVSEHPNDPAAAAVVWTTNQTKAPTVWAARAALWHLVALGELHYSWDGLVSLAEHQL